MTLAQLIERWLDDISPQRTPRTIHEYRRVARHDILPALGTKRIDRLTARDIDTYYRSLLERGLSPASVRRNHALLHASLGRAVKWGLIATNPVDRASPPATRRAQVSAPAVDEVVRLIDAARAEGNSVLATVIAYQARDVALDPAAVDLLAERRLDQENYAGTVGVELAPDPYVLSRDADGSQPCLPVGLGRSHWRLTRELGVKSRFHDLHHFSATQLVPG
jgi:hypothetical protein